MGESAVPPERLRSWLLLGLLTAANPTRRREFLAAYGSLKAAAKATEADWFHRRLLRAGGGKDIFRPASQAGGPEVQATVDDTVAWANGQVEGATRGGASVLCFEDPRYPELLRETPDPPLALFVRGSVGALSRPSIAVVGARCATSGGLEAARSLAKGLAGAGLAVVSGGARGIDSAAHRGALEAGGPTVAVMGAGLDVPYPRENASLFDEVARHGAVISEFPMGTPPQPYHFPLRNRIIAGLSLGVTVVEGKEGSGSLITAASALDAGRDVFAVPGAISSPLSEGPHRLILEGAKLVRRVEDIIEEIPAWADVDPAPPAGEGAGEPGRAAASTKERLLVEAIDSVSGSTADDLAATLDMATGDLLGALMELELKGWIRQLPGGRFVRRI